MPHLQKMPFDPLKDIAPVARISIHSVVVCIGGKSPMNSMKDLVAYANTGNKGYCRRFDGRRGRGHRHAGDILRRMQETRSAGGCFRPPALLSRKTKRVNKQGISYRDAQGDV